MSIGVPLLRNYIHAASSIEAKKPAFSQNVSKEISHAIDSMLKVNNTGGEIAIMQKISEAPESIFKPLIAIITAPDKPASIEQLIAFRRNLFNICKKNPEAKAYIESLTQFLKENKEAGSLISNIGKGVGNYINVFLNSKSLKSGIPSEASKNFRTSANAIMDKMNNESLNTHLQNFFKYLTNN